jgi:hypothetical protein
VIRLLIMKLTFWKREQSDKPSEVPFPSHTEPHQTTRAEVMQELARQTGFPYIENRDITKTTASFAGNKDSRYYTHTVPQIPASPLTGLGLQVYVHEVLESEAERITNHEISEGTPELFQPIFSGDISITSKQVPEFKKMIIEQYGLPKNALDPILESDPNDISTSVTLPDDDRFAWLETNTPKSEEKPLW